MSAYTDWKVLRNWLKAQDVFHPDLEKLLLAKGITDPDVDFKSLSEKEWESIYNEAVVLRAKDLKSQQAKLRWESTLKKIEKHWRKQSGIKKKKKKSVHSMAQNTGDNEESMKYDGASELRDYLKQEQIFDKDLFNALLHYGVKSERDIAHKVDTKQKLDEIIRRVRVQRTLDTKDTKSRQRLEKTLNKFERIIISKNNKLKKTSLRSGDDEKQLKQWETDKERAQRDNEGKDIKQWLIKENIWIKELYHGLIRNGVTSPFMIQCLEESEFDEIVRMCRVERFKDVKDQKARQNVDKMLVKFEKIWRKESGVKKTSVTKNTYK